MWRTVGLGALTALGMAVAAACLLALQLELSGFGRPAGTSFRWVYTASLLVGVLLAVGTPVAVLLRLHPPGTPAVAVTFGVAGTLFVGLVLLMGPR